MKRDDYNSDHELESLLKSMPKVQDEQSMDDLFAKITDRLDGEKQASKVVKKKHWILPSIATAAVVFIGVIFSSNYLNDINIDNYGLPGEEVPEGSIHPIGEEPENSLLPKDDTGQTNPGISSIDGTNLAPEEHEMDPLENINKHGFLGLKIGMSYQDAIEVLGTPTKTEDFNVNFRFLYYGDSDSEGVQLKFNMEDGSIDSYIIYPQFLIPENNRSHFNPPRTREEIEAVLGTNYQIKTSCYEETPCNEHSYMIGNGVYIHVDYEENYNDVWFIQYHQIDER